MWKYTLYSLALILFGSTSALAQCTINAGSDQTICSGQQITLGGAPTAFGGSGSYTYAWTGSAGIPAVANPVIAPNTSATFILTVNDGAGCVQSDEVVITVNATPVVNAGPDLSRCLNTPSINLPNSGGGVWSGAPLTMLTPSGTFTPNALGFFTLTRSVTQGGCPGTDQMVMQVRQLPATNAGSDQTICQGQTVQLGATATSPNGTITLYTWSGGSVSNSLNQNPTATPANTTTYNVTAVDVAGCSSPDQVTVIVQPTPAVSAGAPLTLCNDPVPTALAGQTPAGGVWSGPGVTPGGIFTPSGIGAFIVTYTYTSPLGCPASANRTITVTSPGAINAGPDLAVCLNSAAFTLNPIQPGGVWSGSPLVASNGVFTPTTAGVHSLTYTLNMGTCNATDQAVITVHALPTANAGPDQIVCQGAFVILTGSAAGGLNPYSFLWMHGANQISLTATETVIPVSTSTYTLVVTDSRNCSAADNTTVQVNPLPIVDAGANITLCNNPVPSTLTGQSPPGGTWWGPNVTTAGVFTPSGTGVFTLTYSFTSGLGCVNSATRTVTVTNPSIINAGPDHSVCLNSSSFSLVPVQNGGTWSGSASVTSAGVFSPTSAGTHQLTYSLNIGLCISTDLVVVTVYQNPSVNAGNDVAICQGQSTTLTGIAAGGLATYAYSWSSGGNPVGGSAFVAVSPLLNTTYNLNVIDANNCSATDQVTVTVHSLPIVNAGSDSQFCNNPVPENLSGYSPLGGSWSGSGVTAGGVFTPNGTGTFTLTYTFTNGGGCTVTDQHLVTVSNGVPVNAGADFSQCISADEFELSDNTSSIGTWSGLGILDANSGQVDPVSAGSGVHVYTLSNGSGSCLYTDVVSVTLNGDPIVSAGANVSFCANQGVVTLTGNSPSNGTWFGNQIINANTGTFNASAAPGNYVVGYTYLDPLTGCEATAFKGVAISALPSAAFTLPSHACLNTSFTPVNQSSGASSYQWNFDDGIGVISGPAPSHQFTWSGTYDVQLTAVNNAGCTHSVTHSIPAIAPPAAAMTVTPLIGCAPLGVSVVNNAQGDQLTYNWDFGVIQSTDENPSAVTYTELGGITNYTISLTASNVCGSHSTSQQVTVLPRPEAAFDETILSTMCSPVEVAFTNLSTGNPVACEWDFGNGTMSGDTNPAAMVFTTDSQPSNYEVWLVVQNECGIDSVSQFITVQPNLVYASFNTDVTTGCTPLNVSVENTSTGATDYNFQVAGMWTSTDENPDVLFANPGVYTINMFATDGCGTGTATTEITVMGSPQAAIETLSWETCEGTSVQFTALTDPLNTVWWDLGDGETESGITVGHSYEVAYDYQVTLHVEAPNTCSVSANDEMIVHALPEASFDLEISEGCSPMEMCLENTSLGAVTYSWNFGNGQVSESSNPCITYLNETGAPQTFAIILEAVNEQQCADQASSEIIIYPIPDPSFELSTVGSCSFPFIIPLEYSGDVSTSVNWQVNGGFISAVNSASYTAQEVGQYQITLETSNDFGCTSSESHLFQIYPQPQAILDAEPRTGCVDHDVQFFNLSENASTYVWSFDDGTTSNEADPEHEFNMPGVYDIILTVTSADGCTHSVSMDNFIEAFSLPEASFTSSTQETSIYYPQVTFENTSGEGLETHWNFGDGTISTDANTSHEFLAPGTWPVTLTVTNLTGCQDRTTEYIKITNDLLVFIPNAFTPDGDGLNDSFIPVMASKEFIREYEMWIYDRWGTVIFYTDNPEQPWIGNVREGDHFGQSGTYKYRVMVETEENTETMVFEGIVTMLR